MTRKPKAQSGFTLVELLVAMTILAVGLLAIATMQITAIKANSSANTLSTGAALAQRVMEEILSKNSTSPFFDNSVDPLSVWDLDLADTSKTTITLDGAGVCKAEYMVHPNTPANNITKITVVVTTGQRKSTLVSYKRAL